MRARTATFFSALALASATLTTGTAMADTPCPGAEATPGTVADTVIQQATLCLLNQQRAAAGETALVEQSTLDAVSTTYSQTMVSGQFFSHVSPDGSTMTSRIQATDYLSGYAAWALGENIAWGSGSLSTPANIVVAWMNSPEHRDNILDARFREIGIGVALGAPVPTSAPGATYTTDFGLRSAPRAGIASSITKPSTGAASG
ncbi:MAG: CAP domain-containing protein, partial [Solirubrobacteraceae bacterium]